MYINLGLCLVGFAVVILGFEIYYRFNGSNRIDLQNMIAMPFRSSAVSLSAKSNTRTFYEKKDQSGRLVYSEEVETDEYGRRKSFPYRGSSRAVLFFGCSYTYGSGLSQNQTLPYLFSQESGDDSYIYALPGFSANEALHQVLSLPIANQISDTHRKIDIVYMYYEFQRRRVLGSFQWLAKNGAGGSAYRFNSTTGKVDFQGTFAEARPWFTLLVRVFRQLHLVHYLPELFATRSAGDEKNLSCGIFNEMLGSLKKSLAGRMGRLHVVSPVFKNTNSTGGLLADIRGCLSPEIAIDEILVEKTMDESVIDPLIEYHPNGEFNQGLAKVLNRVL